MFDVGFFELLLVGLVALLVFGPERLPSVARTAGHWLGRTRRFLSTVKADIEQEIKAEELKRIISEQQMNNPLRELVEDTEKSLREAREQAEAALRPVTQPPPAALSEPSKPAEAAPPAPPAPAEAASPAPPAPGGADRAGADVPARPGQ